MYQVHWGLNKGLSDLLPLLNKYIYIVIIKKELFKSSFFSEYSV